MLSVYYRCASCGVTVGPDDDRTSADGRPGQCYRCDLQNKRGQPHDWQRDLDRIAKFHPAKQPLTREPRLWEAFEPDRRPKPPERFIPYTSCAQCGDPMRPSKTRADQYPGTIVHQARRLCKKCYQTQRNRR